MWCDTHPHHKQLNGHTRATAQRPGGVANLVLDREAATLWNIRKSARAAPTSKNAQPLDCDHLGTCAGVKSHVAVVCWAAPTLRDIRTTACSTPVLQNLAVRTAFAWSPKLSQAAKHVICVGIIGPTAHADICQNPSSLERRCGTTQIIEWAMLWRWRFRVTTLVLMLLGVLVRRLPLAAWPLCPAWSPKFP